MCGCESAALFTSQQHAHNYSLGPHRMAHSTHWAGAREQQSPCLLRIHLCLLIQDLLSRRPVHQPLHPSVVVGVVFLHLFHLGFVTKEPRHKRAPRDKGQIGIGALVAHEVLLALQSLVQDTIDAEDLLPVALDG